MSSFHPKQLPGFIRLPFFNFSFYFFQSLFGHFRCNSRLNIKGFLSIFNDYRHAAAVTSLCRAPCDPAGQSSRFSLSAPACLHSTKQLHIVLQFWLVTRQIRHRVKKLKWNILYSFVCLYGTCDQKREPPVADSMLQLPQQSAAEFWAVFRLLLRLCNLSKPTRRPLPIIQ